jgi:cellulose synthase (UDP-forming)
VPGTGRHLHAKAGNVNHALQFSSAEYVAIFDCDHVPTRSFLQVSMGWFLRDRKLSMMQTPQHFFSPDPFEHNLGTFRTVPGENELFYGLLQDGNDLWNATSFSGSCAVLRRSALDRIGGMAVETVTEDAHTSLRLQRQGWNTAYINLPQAAGRAPESLAGHIRQRIRWARGMAQVFRIDNPLFGRGLSLPQRLCYLNSMLHFFGGLPRIVFLTAPLGLLLFDARVVIASASMFAAYVVPHLVHAHLTHSRLQGPYRYSFWAEVYETIVCVYIALPTLLALVRPRSGAFQVTAKGTQRERAQFDRRIALPYLVLMTLNAIGFCVGLWSLFSGSGQDPGSLVLNLLWT